MARSAAAQPPARLPSRSRDRRPALAALAILLVMLGALGSALIAYRSGDREEVLVASREILPGAQVTRDDFTTARIAHDAGGSVSAASIDSFIGAYATTRVPEGTIVINSMFSVSDRVPAGGQLVGLAVKAESRPAELIEQGDVVAVYAVPQAQANSDPVVTTLVPAARVTQVSASDGSGALLMTVLIADADVAKVVGYNAAGQVAVTKLPSDVVPPLDNGS